MYPLAIVCSSVEISARVQDLSISVIVKAVDDKSIRVRWLTVIFNAVASLGSIDYVVTVSGITALHADAESYTTLAPASPVRF